MNYAHFLVRRLMAEQIADSMAQVTGVPEKFPSMPLGTRAMQSPVLPFLKPSYMMKVFGRSDLIDKAILSRPPGFAGNSSIRLCSDAIENASEFPPFPVESIEII